MSTIKISGISTNGLLSNAKRALEEFQGSPLTTDTKVRQFLKNFFNLNNEHTLDSVAASPVQMGKENKEFSIFLKKALFFFNPEDQSIKLHSVEVEYDVVGYYAGKVKIFESIIRDGIVKNPKPTFTDAHNGFRYDPQYEHTSIEDAMDNLQAAINHAFDLCKQIAQSKQNITIESLQADGWTIQCYSPFGTISENPLSIINKILNATAMDTHKVEELLLKLTGTDISKGIFHDDIVKAVEKTRCVFDDKLDYLLSNEFPF